MIIPQFSSVKLCLHTSSYQHPICLATRCSIHTIIAGSHGELGTKVVVIRGLLGDVDVLPMVVKEGGCSLKVRRQRPGREG